MHNVRAEGSVIVSSHIEVLSLKVSVNQELRDIEHASNRQRARGYSQLCHQNSTLSS